MTFHKPLASRWEPAALLRVFVGDDDACGDRPLYEAIVDDCRGAGLAGVTVLRGIAGAGVSARLHQVYRGFSQDLPIVIEIVDIEERIEAWLPRLASLPPVGLVTMENIRMLRRDDVASDTQVRDELTIAKT